MKVYLVIEAESVDYHGTYKEVVTIYETEKSARVRVAELSEKNNSCDTEYYFETYNLEP